MDSKNMGLERTTLDHACNVIRRQVQDEFRDLTLFFVVHKTGQRVKAIVQAEDNLLQHPAGKTALQLFKKLKDADKTGFLGLAIEQKKSVLSFLRRPYILGLFFINVDDFETIKDAREHIYHLTWHALDLIDHYQSQDEHYKLPEGLTLPEKTPLELSRNNLMADTFAAIMLELQGDKGAIKDIARRLAKKTLSPTPHYEAEKYPYPIAMETTELVYKDLKEHLNPKIKITGQAIQLVKEVGMTHDEKSIKQWWAFSARAQEMAWMAFDPETILNAALYASEDPYIRSMAYLVAEAIGIDPRALPELGTHNPFTEEIVNKRLHEKSCEEFFQKALSEATAMSSHVPFLEEAMRQNQRLSDGQLIGWSACALIETAKVFKNADPDSKTIIQDTTETFHRLNKGTSWQSLHKAGKAIMAIRRQEKSITAERMVTMAQKDAALMPIATAFEETSREDYLAEIEDNQTPAPEEVKKLNISDFTTPSHLEQQAGEALSKATTEDA